jgi:hypothetical protein
MTIRKDITATIFTGLAVLAFAATHEGWNVPLIGDSHRWAAGAILLLGVGACAQGTQRSGNAAAILGVLGGLALILGIWALITGSLTALSLLAADTVLLWFVSTVGHVLHAGHRPVAT